MDPLLCGIETEYGLVVEGRGAEDQVEDARAFVRSIADRRFLAWDYRFESPRSDLRGFTVDRLAVDPTDAEFDRGKAHGNDREVRADTVLPNGARLYNDHGHPEYATPECDDFDLLAQHDAAGEWAMSRLARAYSKQTGLDVRVYKNNSDFHGASYGTHENYLAPRALEWPKIVGALIPLLVVRPILVGAGKVGAESGDPVDFQLSQRADFFVEPLNVETLFRRPIFNTRDEPHADPAMWRRIHVIAGDANMMRACTWRKMALVQLVLQLVKMGHCPQWPLLNPVNSAKAVSRSLATATQIDLEGRNWTTPRQIFEGYFGAAESVGLDGVPWVNRLIGECRELLDDLDGEGTLAKRRIDWAAKRNMLALMSDLEGRSFSLAEQQSYDLEYHRVDGEGGLYHAVQAMDLVDETPLSLEATDGLLGQFDGNGRARLRSIAVRHFAAHLDNVSWRALTFRIDDKLVTVDLPVNSPCHIDETALSDVESFIGAIQSL